MQANVRYGHLKKYLIEPILKKFGIPAPSWKYYIAYYIEGITAIIKQWLNDDCADSTETVAAIIEECVRPISGMEGKTHGG